MSKTIQIRVDDSMKHAADELFINLGLDTSTAVRIFLTMAVETGGLPFEVKLPNKSLKQAMNDVLGKNNLSAPYKTAQAAVASMLAE